MSVCVTYLEAELSELAPLKSKDIDFFGTAAQAELCAQLLGTGFGARRPSP